MNTKRTSGSSCAETVPLPWEVVDKHGTVHAAFRDRDKAIEWAKENMPGEQDTSGRDDTEIDPNGWDIQAAGS